MNIERQVARGRGGALFGKCRAAMRVTAPLLTEMAGELFHSGLIQVKMPPHE